MFYDKGLRFECQRCMYCCSAEPGYVYLTEKDIKAASSYLKISEEEFIERYCRLVDFGTYSLVSLQERPDYDCIFLTPHGCSIYEARPSQCRTYPFWENVLASEETWENEGKSCPGIGKGTVISKREIEKRLEKGNEVPFIVIKK